MPRPGPAPGPPAAPPAGAGGPPEERLEYRLRLLVVPVTLLLAWLVTAGGGRMLGRIFLSMWIHELGHAVAAWLCGIVAVPGPWVTPMGGGRSAAVYLLVAAGLGVLAYRAWRAERWPWVVAAGLALAAQAGLTLLLPLGRARVLITFLGDGGGMVLGTLLMTTFYVGAEHPLRTRALRWGFVVIGAFAFADPTRTWWAARTDVDAIPFGHTESAGLSDPSRLEQWGWSATAMTQAYLRLALACLVVLAVVHVRGVLRARRAARRPA